MIIKQDITLFTHLFYRDPAKYLLDQLRTLGDHSIRISLLKEGNYNDEILDHANNIFSDVNQVIMAENRGSDQWGLYNLYLEFLDEVDTDWIFYTHDKHLSKLDWLDEISEPLLEYDDLEKTLVDSGVGMVSTNNWKLKVESESDITDRVKELPQSKRAFLVRQRHTLCWLRELQFILLQNSGFQDMDNVNPEFTAGNVFFIRANILSQALQCVLDPNFFEKVYRMDGDVSHALERFYFYVSTSLGFKNEFIKTDQKIITTDHSEEVVK